jgi:tetratricopeptide (TPR) repeat protein
VTGVSHEDGGSWRYLYTRLGEKKFQELCCVLLTHEFHGVTCFPVGQKDGGRDAARTVKEGSIIYQVKWTNRPERNPVGWLDTAIREEAGKISGLASEGCVGYVIMTNVAGTAARGRGTMDRLRAILSEHSKTFGIQMTCWWQADIDAKVALLPPWVKRDYREMLAGEELVQAIFGSDTRGVDGNGPGPVTLPADPELFTGRSELLAELLEQFDPARDVDGLTVVTAVDGMAGVGKTALAIHVAQLAHEQGWFPGGVLMQDMRGFSADDPVDYGSAAARLLRALGVASEDLPDTPEGRGAAWLDRLARLGRQGRPLLVVLDNVAQAGQVSPLLPRLPHRMLITSRHTLSALRAYRVPIPPFTPDEAVLFIDNALRAARPADGRVNAEPEAARRLAKLCGYLPLALRIIVALLRDQPHRTLAAQASDLTDATNRLDRLCYDDTDERGQPLAVRGAFDLSYSHLSNSPELARAFRLLACIPGPDFSIQAAGVMFDSPPDDARRKLEELTRRHLADQLPGERWGMHDLIRLYAKKQAHEHADADGSESAMQRLYSYYTEHLFAADAWLRSSLTVRPARPGPFGSRARAVAWLDAEYRTLAALAAAAGDSRRWAQAYDLAIHLASYQEFRHLVADGIAVAAQGLTAARHLDRTKESAATMRLGNAHRIATHYEEAISHLKQALELAPADDPSYEGNIRHDLGLAYLRLGRFTEAESCHQRDLEICQATGDWRGAGEAMIGLADAVQEQGRIREAIAILNTAIELFEESGDPRNLALARGNLAHTCLRGFPYTRAAFVIWQLCAGLKHASDLGDRSNQAQGFLNLAVAYLKRCRGCHGRAAVDWGRRAAVVFHEVGDLAQEARAIRFVELAEKATQDERNHPGCPGAEDESHQRLRDWLSDLPYAVLRGAESRLDEASFAGNFVIGPTPDGSRLPDELLAHNPLRLFLPGEDLTVQEAAAVLQETGHLNDSDESAESIAVELAFNASALAMAAAFLRRAPQSARTFLARLRAISPNDAASRPRGEEAASTAKMAVLAIESVEQVPEADRILDLMGLLAPGPVNIQTLTLELSLDGAAEIRAAICALADAALIFIVGNAMTINPHAAQAARDRAAGHGTLLNAAAAVASMIDRQISELEGELTDRMTSLIQQIDTVWSAARPELAKRRGQDGDAWDGAATMMKLRTWEVNALAATSDRATDAIELGNSVLIDCQRLLGETHQETWRARNNLAGAYALAGEYDRACALFAENLPLHDTEPDSPDRLLTRHNLGVMHARSDRPRRAAAILADALAGRERALGPRDPGTLETRHWLGVVLAQTGKLPEAIQLLEDSAEGRRGLSQLSEDLLGTLGVLADLYAESGLSDKALLAREEIVAVSEALLGAGAIRVLSARDALAEQYLGLRSFKKAIALLKRNLAQATQSHGPEAKITRLTRQRLQYAQRQAKKPSFGDE